MLDAASSPLKARASIRRLFPPIDRAGGIDTRGRHLIADACVPAAGVRVYGAGVELGLRVLCLSEVHHRLAARTAGALAVAGADLAVAQATVGAGVAHANRRRAHASHSARQNRTDPFS